MSGRIKELNEIIEIILLAIAREETSIKTYSSALEKATTETTRKMFSLLLEQDKNHEVTLRAQLKEMRAELEIEKMKLKSK